MQTLFERNAPDRCCLCGSREDLTGEHKIKASVIRSLFSGEAMMIGSFDGVSRAKLAQSARSRHFHFDAPLCGPCNSTRTQAADQAFAEFDRIVRQLVANGRDPHLVFEDPPFRIGEDGFVAVYRYLAKVLACQVADSGGPRILAVTDFAIGRSDFDPISLGLDLDPSFQRWIAESGDPEFAGHGGLAVSFSRTTGVADGMRSSLTHGPVRYTFSIAFEPPVARELELFSPDFYGRGEAIFRGVLAGEETD